MNKISYYDDVVPIALRQQIYEFCLKSTYRLGWEDVPDPSKYIPNLYSSWTSLELSRTNLAPYVQECIENTPWFTSKKNQKTIVNLVRPTDVHYTHHHRGKHVALYYTNLDWEDGWYGETIFYDEFKENDIAFTSPYIPGRIVLFDGNVPHTIRPQSVVGPKFRITITLFFDE
tara:strand:- start:83 stop:601 length:519 start_codon:yes stop_codon:yes gene_type:complete